MQIDNKIIWLTGASSGIGEALAYQLAQGGAKLVLCSRNLEKLQALKLKLPQAESHKVLALDLSQADSLETKVAPMLKETGIDILVNNGGISQRGLAKNTQLDVQRKVMEVNYFGTISLTQLLLPQLIQAQGMLVNVASVAGKVGGQSMAGYSASKHALIGYMDSLRAEESRHGLKVLNICPGFVQTQISVNAMNDDGSTYGEVAKSIAEGISAAECAASIIQAIDKDKFEVVIGKGLSGWAPLIKRLFPNLFYRMAAKTNIR